MSLQFCLYLVESEAITANQFVSAIQRQQESRRPIGELLLRQGLMTMKQVFAVLSQQSESQARFGEIAIENGFINRNQLSHILMEQAEKGESLSEILIDQKSLGTDEFIRSKRSYLRGNQDSVNRRTELVQH